MLYSKQTSGPIGDVVGRIEDAVKENRFGVLGTIDLKSKMVEKGVSFEPACVILEVCNPHQAKRVLDRNLAISTSLPCRISVYEEGGKVTVATVKPTVLIDMYEHGEDLRPVAEEVEGTLLRIIDAACAKG